MNGLLNNKPNMPSRLAKSYAFWAVVVVLMYLIRRFIYPGPERVGNLETIDVAVGGTIGIIWSVSTLVRAFLLAKKGVFVEKQNCKSWWRLTRILLEVLVAFAIGLCVLVKVHKTDFRFSNAVLSLILSLFFTYFFASSIGYYFLEWHFDKKFYDKPDI